MSRRVKVTSRRVAELAGVSQTTVSFVLNNVDGVNISEETRQRVLEAARAIGYVPDVSARALARGRSTNIGLVLVQPHEQVFIDEYIPSVITGLSKVTRKHGYRILVEMVEDGSPPNTYLNLIRGKEVAGMIINFDVPSEHDVQELVASVAEGFPIVSLNHCHDAVPSVTVDKLEGVRRVVEHLLGLRHRRIACITYAPVPEKRDATRRLLVYRETLEAAGIDYDEALVRNGSYDPETGYEAMKSLLKVSPLPTALYAMCDVIAFGAMTAIREAGLSIPQDIAVVGFDDMRLARYSLPALTTVREPDIDHGRLAGNMLMALINNKSLEQNHIVLKTEMKIRDSCGFRLRSNGNVT
jgi:DNA-binding LacI/PurR family transcriptional regulator